MKLCTISLAKIENVFYRSEGMHIPSLNTLKINADMLDLLDDDIYELDDMLMDDLDMVDLEELDDENTPHAPQEEIIGVLPDDFFIDLPPDPQDETMDTLEDSEPIYDTCQDTTNESISSEPFPSDLDTFSTQDTLVQDFNASISEPFDHIAGFETDNQSEYDFDAEDDTEEEYDDFEPYDTEQEELTLDNPDTFPDSPEILPGGTENTPSIPVEAIGAKSSKVVKDTPSKSLTSKIIKDTSSSVSDTSTPYISGGVPSNNIEPKTAPQPERNNEAYYSGMHVSELQTHVAKFMIEHGVHKAPVPMDLLEKEFGSKNIERLTRNRFLLIRKNGYTMGQ